MVGAGRRPSADVLVDVDRLVGAYYDEHPDPSDPVQAVSFGTSGHRGSSLVGTFTEDHIVAISISEAIARLRAEEGICGPLYLGRDTHALSEPAFRAAVEVLVAHGVEVAVDSERGYTPTPAISHAILTHNARGDEGGRDRHHTVAQPARGRWLQVQPAPRRPGRHRRHASDPGRRERPATGAAARYQAAVIRRGDQARRHDYRSAYVGDLAAVVDLEEIADAGIRLGVDPLGGASVAYWEAIASRYRLDLEVVNDRVDPTFSCTPLDHDGKIRTARRQTRWLG
jgi:phosphoglucomutase